MKYAYLTLLTPVLWLGCTQDASDETLPTIGDSSFADTVQHDNGTTPTGPQAGSDVSTDVHPGTDTPTDTGVDTGTAIHSGTDSQTDSRIDTNTDADSETTTPPDTGSDSDTVPPPDTSSDSDTVPPPDTDSDSETVPPPDTDTDSGAPQNITAAMGKGFNLGQMFENTQHPRTFAEAAAKIDAYYDRGFRNVRIPITWTENVGSDMLVNDPNVGDVNRSHPRLAVIEQVVDYALAKPGMYVIINAHHESSLKTHNRYWVLERLWQDIADIFGDRSKRLLYEILNEPHRSDANHSPMDPADLRTMTGLAYDKIRAVDPDRWIIIGGNQWFAAHEVPNVWTNLDKVGGGQDPHVMATFHHYNPWSFCGDNQGTYDDPWTDADISGPMDTMLQWAQSVGNGMPVYIGEWGVGWGSVLGQMQCNNIRLYYQKMHAAFASPKGIATSVWDDGGWFKIWDHGSDSFDNNLVDCISGDCAWDGSERFNAACR